MIKGCNWGILVFTLVSFSMAQAQQFDVIPVGPQVQNPYQGQQAQQPAGQGAVPFQPMGPTQYLTGRQIMLPQNQQTLSSKPGFISVAKETVAETVSAFEKYVFRKTIESREREAGTTQGAIAEQPITFEEARAKGIGTTQGAIAEQPITLEEARAKGMLVRQFGYDLFSQPPSTFAPVEQVPVGPDYILGPDDEIRIAVWGKFDGQWVVRVDRNGNITVPKIGVLGVAGLTFQELKELLNREFSKYFTGFEMNVSLGSLRSIRIYVVGNANCPGSYTISSLATLVNALMEAGGPSKIGTMRDIQLRTYP